MIIINKEFFKETDREEITRLLDFCSNLVIIDKDVANSYENSKTAYNASDYIDAFYNLSNYDDDTRNRILLNYDEMNPYYKTLQVKYDIEPAIARESNHMSILKATSNSLSKAEEEMFYDCYYESLKYYTNVIGTSTFKFHDKFNAFLRVFLIWSAVQKYLTRKMDVLFDIDQYDEPTLKNSFISLGLDYFDGLPINYQRTLLKKINNIISNKGSTNCFIDIVDVFGQDFVEISNYYLVKKYVKNVDSTGKVYYDPVLEFYKTPFNKKLDLNSDELIEFEEITVPDPYWYASREEILNKEFNIIKSNYLSINYSMDIYKNTLQFSYFFNFLEKAISDGKISNMDIYNSNISDKPFTLFNAIVALIALGMKINGYKDNIVKNIDVSNYVYGFSSSDNELKVSEFISLIKEELLKDDQMLPEEKTIINEFLNNFNIAKLDQNKYSLTDFLSIFYSNDDFRVRLDEIIANNNNCKVVRYLQKIKELEMRTIVNTNLFEGYSTYSDYLKVKNLNLYNFIQLNESYSKESDLYLDLKNKMNELITSINSQLYNTKLADSISRNTFMGLNNYLEHYIKTLVLLFKPYSLQLIDSTNSFMIKDKSENVKMYDSFEKYLVKSEAEYVGLNEKLEIYKGSVKIL